MSSPHYPPALPPHSPYALAAQPYSHTAFYHLFSLLISPSPLLSLLSPSTASHRARSALFSALSSILSPLCSVYPPFLFGSTPLHTYLPSGDLDVGIVVRSASGEGVATAGGVESERLLLRVKERLEEEERRWKTHRASRAQHHPPPSSSHPHPPANHQATSADEAREGETSTDESPNSSSATDSPASSPHTATPSSSSSSAASTVLPVHSITFVNASEVKLVKLQVGPLLVDVSTNTSAALATVCFLEEADREIDRSLLLHYPPVPSSTALPPSTSPPHLLKQSILLIKSWCLYEARILASHHSLLSTYCLETLVIYILNHYHCHLHHTAADPFVVLSLFMHVFAVYNWEEWGLSVTGPVRKDELQSAQFAPHHLFSLERSTASVPPLLASPFPHANHPLLSPSFFYALYTAYALPAAPPARPFQAKHMNVVDPLDLTNNLGRSVNFSNLWRVRLCLRKGASEMVRVLSEGRECVEAMLREMEEANSSGGNGRRSAGGKASRGRPWMEDNEVLQEPEAFQDLIASLPLNSTTAAPHTSSVVCPSLPFSSSLLHRLSAHHQLVHAQFAHTWQHHTSVPRPDCHLVQRLREEGVLLDSDPYRLPDGGDKQQTARPASTLSPPSATSSHSSTAASSLASEPLPSTLARRLLAMPSQPQSLSRDDSSLSLSLPPRAPTSSRSLFVSTLPHPTPVRDVVAVSGTFSPLIEPSSCPPPSTNLSPRHSLSCPPSPAVSASPTLSPVTSPSPSPSPELTDPLASSLNALCALFFPLKQLHLAALHSAYQPAMGAPPHSFHPHWLADGQRSFGDGHRNGARHAGQQQQQQWGKAGQGKGKHGRAMRDRAERREEKEREGMMFFHPPSSPHSATHTVPDAAHAAQTGSSAQNGQHKKAKKNGLRQQQQQQHQQHLQQQHYLAAVQQHQQQQQHMHGLPPPVAFHMYPPPPAPHPQHNVRRQYVNLAPQQPPYPPHGWQHSVYAPPPHHMQPPHTPPPLAISPNLSPASPRSANGIHASASLPPHVSRIHLLPSGAPGTGQPGVLQQVRSFLEADDARSFAAVLQPQQLHGRHQQQQHVRGGSGGSVPAVVDGGAVRNSGSPQKQKAQRSQAQAERRATEVPIGPSPARPNRRRSDGEFPQPIALGQPEAPQATQVAASGGASPSLSMARSWSTAVGAARTSPSPSLSLSSPAQPSLLADPPAVPLPLFNHSASLQHLSEQAGAGASSGGGTVDGGGSTIAAAVGGASGAVGAVQYPGPPKGERRHKAKKDRAVFG